MGGILHVTVKAAHGLQDTEQWGKQDPYCVLRLTGEPQTLAASETCMKGGVDPSWSETLSLPVHTASPGELSVELFNQNRAAPDDLIGYGKVRLDDVLSGIKAAMDVQVPLTSHPSGRQEGHMELTLNFTPLSEEQLATAIGSERITPSPLEQLPAAEGAEFTTEAALQPPEASDLRRMGPNERAYDRVHRPGYTQPPSLG